MAVVIIGSIAWLAAWSAGHGYVEREGVVAADSTTTSPCVGKAGRVVAPDRIELGDTAAVTVSVALDCPGQPLPMDVVLAVDHSPSMRGEPIREARAAADAFVAAIDLSIHRVAIVGFDGRSHIAARLSGDARYLRSAISQLEVAKRGGTDITGGLREAGRALDDRRARPEASQAIVLLSDGLDNFVRLAVLQQARMQREQGRHLITVALGGGADAALMQEIATSPADALHAPFNRDLVPVFRQAADRIGTVDARDAVLQDRLPADIRVVEGSPRPSALLGRDDLTWTFPVMVDGGVTVTWRIRPSRVGRQPASSGGTLRYVDSLGRKGEVDVPDGEITVVNAGSPWPGETPTETATVAPEATETPIEPAASPTVTDPAVEGTPTARPSPGGGGATPTSGRYVQYLPIVGAAFCPSEARSIDLIVVLDTSTTMERPEPDGRRRIDIAAQSVIGLAERLLVDDARPDGASHRMAVLAFDEQARLVVPLTSETRAVRTALVPGLATAQGSRIDRGLQDATAHLSRHRRPDAAGVIVLMSDGHVVGATDAEVRSAADAARHMDLQVWSVAIGTAARRSLLEGIAGHRSRLIAPGSVDRLVQSLRRFALELPCRMASR